MFVAAKTRASAPLSQALLGLAAFTRENGLQGAVFGATREQAERRTPSARLPPGAPGTVTAQTQKYTVKYVQY